MLNQDLQNSRVDLITVKVPNWHQRQLKNIGLATDPNDAVCLSQLQDAIASIKPSGPTTVKKTSVTNNITETGGGSSTYGNYNDVTPSSGSAAISLASQPDWTTFEVLANASTITIANPTGGSTGQHFTIVCKQSSSGGNTFLFGSNYSGVSDQTWLNNNASKYMAISFVIRPDGKAMAIGVPYADETY